METSHMYTYISVLTFSFTKIICKREMLLSINFVIFHFISSLCVSLSMFFLSTVESKNLYTRLQLCYI